jgi:hypothetical protein
VSSKSEGSVGGEEGGDKGYKTEGESEDGEWAAGAGSGSGRRGRK